MNDERGDSAPIGDQQVIERLRAALDEVAASEERRPSAGSRSTETSRLIGVAAVTVLLIGGAVWALSRRGGTVHESPPAASTSIDVTPSSAVTVLVKEPSAWFALIAADLAPGRIVRPPCCPVDGAASGNMQVAWIIDTGGTPDDPEAWTAMLTMTAVASASPTAPTTISPDDPARDDPVTVRPQPDGSVWVFSSFGLTDVQREALADQVVPGSGLPFLLPDPSATFLGFGFDGDSDTYRQYYDGPAGSVEISVSTYRGQLSADAISGPTTARPVTVVGGTGLSITSSGGTTVVWRAADQRIALLRIPPEYADRVDGLIAAVVPAPAPT